MICHDVQQHENNNSERREQGRAAGRIGSIFCPPTSFFYPFQTGGWALFGTLPWVLTVFLIVITPTTGTTCTLFTDSESDLNLNLGYFSSNLYTYRYNI